MPHKLRFIWEERGINEEAEKFKFNNRFQDLKQPLFCGKFNQPVSIEGIEVEILHFSNFKFSDGIFSFEMDSFIGGFKVSKYEDLSFEMITPGI